MIGPPPPAEPESPSSASGRPAGATGPGPPPDSAPPAHTGSPLGAHALRCALGGALMGLANLVPGISGGTMLLASGVYTAFIGAVSDLTRLRVRVRSLVTLAVVVGAALAAIVLLAGPVKTAVVEGRWVMYSLFIGLTLGGVPLIWKRVRPMTPGAWAGAAVGLGLMIALAVAGGGGGSRDGVWIMFIAGLCGASAMILPGVSGGYLLLLLGAYVPILASIDELKAGVEAGVDARSIGPIWGAGMDQLGVVLPVEIGVVVVVGEDKNLLRVLLERQPQPTLGVLLGLLIGAAAGLWPFAAYEQPAVGDTVDGQEVLAIEERLIDEDDPGAGVRTVAVTEFKELEQADWPTRRFSPSTGQAAASAALVLVGIGVTVLIGRLDRGDD